MDFTQANNTIILSDIHLADAEPPHPHNPLWKRYKRPKLFIDRHFKAFLEYIEQKISGQIELILNGDIFDFDSVMAIPDDLRMHVNWLERARGLSSEEMKSRFKIKVILNDHPVWVESLRNFILRGHRVVFVIGNHDMELHWPSVQKDIISKLGLDAEHQELVRFCEWFYISNHDTLIEHGHQYDAYCMSANPINPLIKKGSKVSVRVPFGNLAGKFMLNGMGLMNPHADSSFIKETLWEYVVFYYKYVMRTQPLLLWTWFWSAFVTMVYSISEGLLPAMTDPLTIDARVDDIANKSNSSPKMVWLLKELHVHPAIYNPLKILRELWLDRAILLVLIFALSFQFFSVVKLFAGVSYLWFVIPVLILFPFFLFYVRTVESELEKTIKVEFQMAPISAQIAKVSRVVHGHTHKEKHTRIDGIEYLNPGTWSPAYHDVECTQPFGRKCFIWIKPGGPTARVADLFEWKDSEKESASAELIMSD